MHKAETIGDVSSTLAPASASVLAAPLIACKACWRLRRLSVGKKCASSAERFVSAGSFEATYAL